MQRLNIFLAMNRSVLPASCRQIGGVAPPARCRQHVGSPPAGRSQRDQWLSTLVLAVVLGATPAAQANLTFNFVPVAGTPQYAVDGFATAANLWSSVLADNVTVNLAIGFAPLGAGVIGQSYSDFAEFPYAAVTPALASHRTSADDYSAYAALQPGASYQRIINHTSDNPNGANSATPYLDSMDRVGLTTANAKALGLSPAGSALDGFIQFSSNFSFDFNHGSTIQPGKLDFVGAAAHEIGHVLGFVSGVDDIDMLGGVYAAGDFSSNLIDLFRYSDLSRAAGDGYLDYTADNRDKYFSTDGGLTAIALFANGITYGDGRQASHWRDNLGIGLMDPTAAYGELLTISATDLRAFDVLGYTIGVPEPGLSTTLVTCSGLGLFLWVRSRNRIRGRSSPP